MPAEDIPISSEQPAPGDVEITDPLLAKDHVINDAMKGIEKYMTEMHEEEEMVEAAQPDEAGMQLASEAPDDPIDDEINEPDLDQVELPEPQVEPGDDDG